MLAEDFPRMGCIVKEQSPADLTFELRQAAHLFFY